MEKRRLNEEIIIRERELEEKKILEKNERLNKAKAKKEEFQN